MYRNALVSGFTIISLLLGLATTTPAEITLKPSPYSTNQPRSNPRATSKSSRSMKYVEMGIAAQKKGQSQIALLYYYQAIKTDKTNGHAFMGAAALLGATDDGILCMTAAAALFLDQGAQDSYEVAMKWLQDNDPTR